MKRPGLSNISLLIAVILPFFLPPCAMLTKVLPWILGIVLFISFMRIDPAKLKISRELFYYPVFSTFAFPLLAFAVSVTLPEELRAGMILIAAAPSATSSPVMSDLVGGNRNLSILLSLSSNLLAPAVFISATFIFGFSPHHISIGSMMTSSALVLGLPLALSIPARFITPVRSLVATKGSAAASVLFPVIVFTAVSSAKGKIDTSNISQLLHIGGAVGVLCVTSFSAGLLLSKKRSDRISISLLFGHKNTALAIWFAVTAFSPIAAVPSVIYIIFHHAANSILMWKSKR